MRMQEIFNSVALHLLQQGARSIRDGNEAACAYRGDHGRKCAVGFLIPDALYGPDLEGRRVNTPEVMDVLIKAGVLDSYDPFVWKIALLSKLQLLHDRTDPHRWKFGLEHIAQQLGLEMPKLASECKPKPFNMGMWFDELAPLAQPQANRGAVLRRETEAVGASCDLT